MKFLAGPPWHFPKRNYSLKVINYNPARWISSIISIIWFIWYSGFYVDNFILIYVAQIGLILSFQPQWTSLNSIYSWIHSSVEVESGKMIWNVVSLLLLFSYENRTSRVRWELLQRSKIFRELRWSFNPFYVMEQLGTNFSCSQIFSKTSV
jgi:hypothetical protein